MSSKKKSTIRKRGLKFDRLKQEFAVCRLSSGAELPSWAMRGEFTSVTRTSEELSIVCPAANVPQSIRAEKGWMCLKLIGPFRFTETGILASFIDCLADRSIGVFTISTYDTDYVLVKEDDARATFQALAAAGHELQPRARKADSAILSRLHSAQR